VLEFKATNLDAFQKPIADALAGIENLKTKIGEDFYQFQDEDMNRKNPKVLQSGDSYWFTFIRMYSRLRALREFRAKMRAHFKKQKIKVRMGRIRWAKGVILDAGPLLYPEMRERLTERMRALLHQGVLKK
jgi:hypothetical protein